MIPTFTGRRWGSRLETYASQPTLTALELSLGLDRTVQAGRLARSGTSVEITEYAGRVRVRIPRLAGPDIVVLEEGS